MEDFATGALTMPEAEARLKSCLGSSYQLDAWKPVFDAVFNTEEDTLAAIEAVKGMKTRSHSVSNPSVPATSTAASNNATVTVPSQLENAQSDLLGSVDELVRRRRIFERPTLEDLLNPIEEGEVGFSPYTYTRGDAEIVEVVRSEIVKASARAKGDGDESDDGEDFSDDDDEPTPLLQGIDLCEKMEKLCLERGGDDSGLDLAHLVRKLRIQLREQENAKLKQSDLHKFFPTAGVSS